ncbi:MAG: hypothetical protein IKK96_03700 [Lachnospiraceae bacterium]|nr:hypothetical protein [Lachnospiraceae bacterium]
MRRIISTGEPEVLVAETVSFIIGADSPLSLMIGVRSEESRNIDLISLSVSL